MREPLQTDPLAERSRISSEGTALVRAGDGARWTYSALDDAVERTAGRLASFGVGPGSHVGLLAHTGVPAVRTVYAALRLGAVAVPLNARLTAEELVPQVDAADLDALVCERGTEATAVATAEAASPPSDSVRIVTLDEPDHGDVFALAGRETAGFDAPVPDTDERRLLLFTSGTTGDPKAVELTAGNLRTSAIASAFRLGVEPGDRWFVPLAIYHVGGFAPVYRSVLYGTTAIVQREFDAGPTLERLREHEATCLSVVPTMLRQLLDASNPRRDDPPVADSSGGDRPADPLSDLRFVLSGGAATPRPLVDRCAERDVPLCPTYGTTETASQIATALPAEAREHATTVGRPLVPVTVTVLDPDGESLPPGDVGEVVVDGPTVSPGYYGDPEATDATRSELGYHTGDLGTRDAAGRLRILGRADDRLVTGGEVVHPAEVTDVLGDHPSIRDAAVVGLDDEAWGERVAALVAADGLAPATVRAHCEDRLAGFKHPRTVAVVAELPRTPSGTVDRAAVRELLEADGVEV